MIRILHAADLHLDSAFEALSDARRPSRLEQRELLLKMARLAETSEAGFCSWRATCWTAKARTWKPLKSFNKSSVASKYRCLFLQATMTTGLPLPYARIKMPENIHIFKSETIQCVELPELGARVWGAGFVSGSAPPLFPALERKKAGIWLT